jgi:hypothetical protein
MSPFRLELIDSRLVMAIHASKKSRVDRSCNLSSENISHVNRYLPHLVNLVKPCGESIFAYSDYAWAVKACIRHFRSKNLGQTHLQLLFA